MNGAITTFGTVINEGFGFNSYQVVLLDIPRNAFSVLWFVIVGWTSLKYKGLR
jgi:ACS family allantoate permease-like MFS transporter